MTNSPNSETDIKETQNYLSTPHSNSSITPVLGDCEDSEELILSSLKSNSFCIDEFLNNYFQELLQSLFSSKDALPSSKISPKGKNLLAEEKLEKSSTTQPPVNLKILANFAQLKSFDITLNGNGIDNYNFSLGHGEHNVEDSKILHDITQGILNKLQAKQSLLNGLLTRETENLYREKDAANFAIIKQNQWMESLDEEIHEIWINLRHFNRSTDNLMNQITSLRECFRDLYKWNRCGKIALNLLSCLSLLEPIQTADLKRVLKSLNSIRKSQSRKVIESWKSDSNVKSFATTSFYDEELGEHRLGSTVLSSNIKEPYERFTSFIAQNLELAEKEAIDFGLPPVLVLRRYTEVQILRVANIRMLIKDNKSSSRLDVNLRTYSQWLDSQLTNDLFLLIKYITISSDITSENQEKNTITKKIPSGNLFLPLLYKALELVTDLWSTLHGNIQDLQILVRESLINELKQALRSSLFLRFPDVSLTQTTSDNPSTMIINFFEEKFKPHTEEILDFINEKVKWGRIILERISGYGTRDANKLQFLRAVIDCVANFFVQKNLSMATQFRQRILQQEGTLAQESKKKHANFIAEAIGFSYCIYASISSFCKKMIQSYEVTCIGDLKEALDYATTKLTNILVTYDVSHSHYSSDRQEIKLLNRYHLISEDLYGQDFQQKMGSPVALHEGHIAKMGFLTDKSYEILARYIEAVPPNSLSTVSCVVIKEITLASLSFIYSWLENEAIQTYKFIKHDRENWIINPLLRKDLTKSSAKESHQNVWFLLSWFQSSLQTIDRQLAKLFHSLGPIFQPVLREINRWKGMKLEILDEKAEAALNLSIQSMTIRSFSYLYFSQKKHDFLPNDNQTAFIPQTTKACKLFCDYLSQQIATIEPLLTTTFISIAFSDTDNEKNSYLPVYSGQSDNQPAGKSLLYNDRTSTEKYDLSFQNHAFISMISDTKTDITPAKSTNDSLRKGHELAQFTNLRFGNLESLSLRRILTENQGKTTIVQMIGIALFKGIVSHLSHFKINSLGSLIYKQDVMRYKEVMNPFTQRESEDALIISMLFQLLVETSSLFMVSRKQLNEVQNSGLLRLLSLGDVDIFLSMRSDKK